jgi:hypothetical protein
MPAARPSRARSPGARSARSPGARSARSPGARSATAGSAPACRPWPTPRTACAARGGGAARRYGRADALRGRVPRYNGAGAAGPRATAAARAGPAPRTRGPAGGAEGPGVPRGPDPERDGWDGCGGWRLRDPCRPAEDRSEVRYAGTGMPRPIKGPDPSRRKARPRHPRASRRGRDRFKGGRPARLPTPRPPGPGPSGSSRGSPTRPASRPEGPARPDPPLVRGRRPPARRPRGARDVGFASARLCSAPCARNGARPRRRCCRRSRPRR